MTNLQNENNITLQQKIENIKNTITDNFKDLQFIEKGHQYFLNGISLPSVSEVTHNFCQYPFDAETKANEYALKHGQTPEYWKNEWLLNNYKASTTGTLVHEFAESLGWLLNGHEELITDSCKQKLVEIDNKKYLIPTRPKEEAVIKFYQEKDKNLYFVTAETKVYSNKNEISNVKQQFCGTFDLLMYYDNPIDKNKSGLVVLDWKTNKSLTKEYSHIYNKTLLQPFNNLYEESISYYILQLNLYSMCLAGIGLPPIAARIIWLKDDGNYELIPIKLIYQEKWFKNAF